MISNLFGWQFGWYSIATTDEEYSVLRSNTVRIPVKGSAKGSYLYKRKHHLHEGIDIYTKPMQPVYALEHGRIVNIVPFTGELAGSPWWNNTYAVLIEDNFGVWCYGEIDPDPTWQIGDVILAGERIGVVSTVLKEDKGRPMDMLHLERYTKGTRNSIGLIPLDSIVPENLCDPVPRLTGVTTSNNPINYYNPEENSDSMKYIILKRAGSAKNYRLVKIDLSQEKASRLLIGKESRFIETSLINSFFLYGLYYEYIGTEV